MAGAAPSSPHPREGWLVSRLASRTACALAPWLSRCRGARLPFLLPSVPPGLALRGGGSCLRQVLCYRRGTVRAAVCSEVVVVPAELLLERSGLVLGHKG